MSGRKTITYINFLQGIPAPIVALGGMIKVFLFYPLLCVTLQKINLSAHPQFNRYRTNKIPLRIYLLIYLLYLTKDLAKKKKITMVKPFARSSGMDILNLAAPPGQSLRDGLAGDPYEGFYLIT